MDAERHESDFDEASDYDSRPPDAKEAQAVEQVRAYFEENSERVFCSRQIEVHFEGTYFHWITHRALKLLAEEGAIKLQQRTLAHGAPINILWHRRNRYVERQAKDLIRLVESYSEPDFTAALGNTGELLVGDGFARFGFAQRGRNVREYKGRVGNTLHNLDFILERDGREYGVEVKNTLPYINDKELRIKIALCRKLEIFPLFVVRAMPRIWIGDVAAVGGFTLVLRHQLYPLSHRALAQRVREELGLPVDAPRALFDGTMQRFEAWHTAKLSYELCVNCVGNSHGLFRKALYDNNLVSRSMKTSCLALASYLLSFWPAEEVLETGLC